MSMLKLISKNNQFLEKRMFTKKMAYCLRHDNFCIKFLVVSDIEEQFK